MLLAMQQGIGDYLRKRVCGNVQDRQGMDAMSEGESIFPQTRPSVIGPLKEEKSERSERAWQIFFQIYGPVIYRFSRHAGLNDGEAEEVLARVVRNLLIAFRNGLVIINEKGRFRHYLRTVTNRVIHAVRADRPRGEDLEAPEPEAELQNWSYFELAERLRACLARLGELGVNPRDVAVFEALVLRQKSPETIAHQYGLSVARVYVIKHEMIKKVRKLHEKLCGILGEAGE